MEKPLLISRETLRVLLKLDEPKLTDKEIEDFINKEFCFKLDLNPIPEEKYPIWKSY